MRLIQHDPFSVLPPPCDVWRLKKLIEIRSEMEKSDIVFIVLPAILSRHISMLHCDLPELSCRYLLDNRGCLVEL